jgi:phthiocerol/phenolphthiocerol synthesis type-I polyketide synthase C
VLAHRRHALGLPATSINWGFWDEVGMMPRGERDNGRRIQPRGMTAISPSDGIAVLDRLLSDGTAQVTVLQADWPEWAAAYPAASAAPIVRELAEPAKPSVVPPAPAPVPAPRSAPAPAPEPAPVPAPVPAPAPAPALGHAPVPAPAPALAPAGVEPEITGLAAKVLGLRADSVVRDRPLNRQGMDSLMAVELRNLIDRDLKVNVPVVKILNGGTVAALARLVADSRQEATAAGLPG